MSTNKIKRLSQTITQEIIFTADCGCEASRPSGCEYEEENKKELKPGEVFKVEQRNKSPEPNNKCCGIFSCCGVHNTINGNNNNVNTDKTIDNKADVNVGIKK